MKIMEYFRDYKRSAMNYLVFECTGPSAYKSLRFFHNVRASEHAEIKRQTNAPHAIAVSIGGELCFEYCTVYALLVQYCGIFNAKNTRMIEIQA